MYSGAYTLHLHSCQKHNIQDFKKNWMQLKRNHPAHYFITNFSKISKVPKAFPCISTFCPYSFSNFLFFGKLSLTFSSLYFSFFDFSKSETETQTDSEREREREFHLSSNQNHGLCVFQSAPPWWRVLPTRQFITESTHCFSHFHHLWPPHSWSTATKLKPHHSSSTHNPTHSFHPLWAQVPMVRTQVSLVWTQVPARWRHQLVGTHGWPRQRKQLREFPFLQKP